MNQEKFNQEIIDQYKSMIDIDKDGVIGLGDIQNFISLYLSDMNETDLTSQTFNLGVNQSTSF